MKTMTCLVRFLPVLALTGSAAGCGAGGSMLPPSQPAGVVVGLSESAQGAAPANSPMAAEAAAPPAPASQAGAPAAGRASPAHESGPSGVAKADRAPEVRERPGLGTQWGETRYSGITTVSFARADWSTPLAVGAIFYNDEEGARAMSNALGFRRTPAGSFSAANGLISVGIRDEGRGFLSGFVSGGRAFVVGEAGRRYSIVLRNNTDVRLEVVASVDGLDVLDGQPAGYDKRGYIIEGRDELEIDGFRQSSETVAAFRFGSVRGSYANQKHGDTRNVGVIGVAVFNERGTHPVPWTAEEIDRRQRADPFPSRFATPP